MRRLSSTLRQATPLKEASRVQAGIHSTGAGTALGVIGGRPRPPTRCRSWQLPVEISRSISIRTTRTSSAEGTWVRSSVTQGTFFAIHSPAPTPTIATWRLPLILVFPDVHDEATQIDIRVAAELFASVCGRCLHPAAQKPKQGAGSTAWPS